MDISETDIPDGSIVRLKAVVKLGSDNSADDQFTYSADSAKMATYTISGTTLINSMTFNSYE